jgi:hypothetical protein
VPLDVSALIAFEQDAREAGRAGDYLSLGRMLPAICDPKSAGSLCRHVILAHWLHGCGDPAGESNPAVDRLAAPLRRMMIRQWEASGGRSTSAPIYQVYPA